MSTDQKSEKELDDIECCRLDSYEHATLGLPSCYSVVFFSLGIVVGMKF
jgi:hypothetical protein